MKRGICFSGGGIKCAAHIGAVKVFEEENIKFDYISGTSSGSIIGALYALGYTADEMLELLIKYSKKINYVEYKYIFKLIFDLIFFRKIKIDGLNSGKKLEKSCQKNLLNVISSSINILCHELSNYEVEGNKNMINIETKNIDLLDSTQIEYLYKIGYNETKKYIKNK